MTLALHINKDDPNTQHDALHDLIERAVNADQHAQRLLVQQLMPRVSNSLIYLVSNPSDRDDILQMVFIQILKSLHAYSGQGFYAWIDCITVRTAMRQIKKAKWWHIRFKNEPPHSTPAHTHTEDQVILRKRLTLLLQKLSPEHRTAIVLKHIHGYSIAEIANITDTLENTIRGRLRAGKKNLRGHIKRDATLRAWCENNGIMEDT